MEFWDTKPFGAVNISPYWDLIGASPTGNVMTSEVFVQWKIMLKTRSVFDPKRKIEEGRI